MSLAWICLVFSALIFNVNSECEDLTKHRNYALIPEAAYCGQSYHLWSRTPSRFPGVYNFTEGVQERIRGGAKSHINEFPWMAFLRVKLTLDRSQSVTTECGGALINENYVLTAAHCFKPPKSLQYRPVQRVWTDVFLGRHLKPQSSETGTMTECGIYIPSNTSTCYVAPRKRSGARIISHPGHNRQNYDNDIALLRLDVPVKTFSQVLMPICLPLKCELRQSEFRDSSVTISGWGDDGSNVAVETLKKYDAKITGNEWCAQIWNKPRPASMTCAVGQVEDGACGGDSGSPMVMETSLLTPLQEPRYVLMGLVNLGTSCDPVSDPAEERLRGLTPLVLAYVPYHMKWILDNIES